ncbi:hypothetical protein BJV78DRAFT_1157260 [Lactifluus subvellereus]|nr:hypothetical protein BJV78DRAFT_1157260 [Lactifluus subvellereus]
MLPFFFLPSFLTLRGRVPDPSAGGAIPLDLLPGESDPASSFQHNGNEAAPGAADDRDEDKLRGERRGCTRTAVPQMGIETRSCTASRCQTEVRHLLFLFLGRDLIRLCQVPVCADCEYCILDVPADPLLDLVPSIRMSNYIGLRASSPLLYAALQGDRLPALLHRSQARGHVGILTVKASTMSSRSRPGTSRGSAAWPSYSAGALPRYEGHRPGDNISYTPEETMWKVIQGIDDQFAGLVEHEPGGCFAGWSSALVLTNSQCAGCVKNITSSHCINHIDTVVVGCSESVSISTPTGHNVVLNYDAETIVVVKYMVQAEEIDMVAVVEDGKVIMQCTSKYIEDAGVHSGNVTPHTSTRYGLVQHACRSIKVTSICAIKLATEVVLGLPKARGAEDGHLHGPRVSGEN